VFLAVALLALMAVATPPVANAFSLQEGVNTIDAFPRRPGDPVLGGSVPLVAVEGVNVASGRFACQGFGCMDNFDSFRIEVPAGLQIILTDFFVPRSQEPNSNDDGTAEQFFVFASDGVSFIEPDPDGPAWKAGALFGITVFPDNPEQTSMAFGPGLYDVVAANCCDPAPVGGGSWAIEFSVSMVPEPSTALLVGLGLLGLSARGRWRRA
jgi:hypothetical protein